MKITIYIYASQFPSGRWVGTYSGGQPVVASSSEELAEAICAVTNGVENDLRYELAGELEWPERIAHPARFEENEPSPY